MALNTFKCNYLTPLHFQRLTMRKYAKHKLINRNANAYKTKSIKITKTHKKLNFETVYL